MPGPLGIMLGNLAMGGGSILPLTVDFTALPDGALPASTHLTGATWTIASGVAVNAPTLGPAELLTDPGLEAAYTAGLCGSLNKQGTPTIAEETVDVHGGSKAQSFASAGVSAVQQGVNVLANRWYQYSMWHKHLGGTASPLLRFYEGNSLPQASEYVQANSATYAQAKVSKISTAAEGVLCGLYSTANPGDATLMDDHSLKVIDEASLFALLPASTPDVVVKAQISTLMDGTYCGLVVRADAQTNPNSAILVLYRSRYNNAAQFEVSIVKKVAGAYSSVKTVATVTLVENAWLEARTSGATLQLFYNAIQVGTDLTVSDAELVANRHHGLFSSGGNSLDSFFAGAN